MKSSNRIATLAVCLLVVGTTLAGSTMGASVVVSGNTKFSTTGGPTVTFAAAGNAKLDLSSMYPSSGTLQIETPESGSVTFSSSASTSATLPERSLSNSTTVEQLSVSNTNLTVNPSNKPQVKLEGGFDSFTYSGSSLVQRDVSYDASSSATVTVYGMDENANYELVDGSGSHVVSDGANRRGTVKLSVPSGSVSEGQLRQSGFLSLNNLTAKKTGTTLTLSFTIQPGSSTIGTDLTSVEIVMDNSSLSMFSDTSSSSLTAAGVDTDGDGTTETDLSDDLDSWTVEDGGSHLTVGFGGTAYTNPEADDTIILSITDIRNPDDGDYRAKVQTSGSGNWQRGRILTIDRNFLIEESGGGGDDDDDFEDFEDFETPPGDLTPPSGEEFTPPEDLTPPSGEEFTPPEDLTPPEELTPPDEVITPPPELELTPPEELEAEENESLQRLFGGSPGVNLAPTTITFGGVGVGQTRNRTVKVFNEGNASLSVTDVSVDGPGADAYSVSRESFVVAPGESESVRVTFAPAAPRPYGARVTVEHNATDGADEEVFLGGRGVEGDPSVTPTTIDFGRVSTSTQVTRTVTIANDGSGPVTVTDLSTTGDTDSFTVPNGSLVLQANETRAVPVTFAPSSSGPKSATVIVATSEGQLGTAVNGTGTESNVTALTQRAAFGTVGVGNESEFSVAYRNDGALPVEVTGYEVVGPAADSYSVPDPNASSQLSSGEAGDVTVTFAPETPGLKPARLQVLGPGGVPLVGIPLNGTVLPPDASVSTGSLTFAGTTVGETATKQLTVANEGRGTLRVRDVSIASSQSSFAVRSERTFEVLPGESRTVTVAYTPTSTAEVSQSLLIRSNDPDQPTQSVLLSSTDVTGEIAINRTQGTTQVTADLTDVEAGTDVSIGVGGGNTSNRNPVAVDSVSIEPETSGNLSMNVTSSETVPENTTDFDAGSSTDDLNYLDVEKSISNENISQAQFTFRVNKSDLEGRQSEPKDVEMYREVNGSWQPKPATLVNETDDEFVFRTNASGLSEWTVAAQQPSISVTDAAVNVTAATVGDAATIDVVLTNTGGSDGLFVTKLLLNSTVVERREVTVAANASSLVFFERSFDNPGNYTVQVNDIYVATVAISDEPDAVTVAQQSDLGGTTTAQQTVPSGTETTTSSSGPGFGVGAVVLAVAGVLVGLARLRE